MALARDRCICLSRIEYSETSQILTLFGRSHGLLRVIAKGAHRKTKAGASRFGGGVDLLDIGDAVFTDRAEQQLATLTEWELLEGHLPLRRSLRALYLSFYAAELVALLIEEHDPHPELFDRLEQMLLELPTPRIEQTFLSFELDLLRATGYLPELSACASCGGVLSEKSKLWFAPDRGGVVCDNCQKTATRRFPLDSQLLRVMQYVLNIASSDTGPRRLPGLTRHQTDPINRLLAAQIEYTVGRRLRLPKYVIGTD